MGAVLIIVIWLILMFALVFITTNSFKFLYRKFPCDVPNMFYFIPRIWVNKCFDTPNFEYFGIVLRWADFYVGFEINNP